MAAMSTDLRTQQIAFAAELEKNQGRVSDKTKSRIAAMPPFAFHDFVEVFKLNPSRDSKSYDDFNLEKFLHAYREKYIIKGDTLLAVYVLIGYLKGVMKTFGSVLSMHHHYFNMACAYGHLDIIEYFKSKGCFYRNSGFETAAACGQLEIATYLSASWQIDDDVKKRAMYSACQNRKLDIIAYLVKELSVCVNIGFRPIHLFDDPDDVEKMMNYLLDLDAAIPCEDETGNVCSKLDTYLDKLINDFDVDDNIVIMATCLLKRGAKFSSFYLERMRDIPELRTLKVYCP